jgi:hypothetical protein
MIPILQGIKIEIESKIIESTNRVVAPKENHPDQGLIRVHGETMIQSQDQNHDQTIKA